MKTASLCILVASALLLNSCSKKIENPNTSDFHLTQLSPSVKGIRGATVQISSSSLASGEYVFSYVSKFNSLTNFETTNFETIEITMVNGTATFSTRVLDYNDGRLYEELTFSQVTNKDRATSNFSTNNRLYVTDSSGSVHVSISKTSPATTDSLNTYTALAYRSTASGYITLQFVDHDPYTAASKQIYFAVSGNVTAGKSFTFGPSDSLVRAEYYDLGDEYYGIPTSTAHHGTITFSKVTPTIEGTFYFVTDDSTRCSGTFSALTHNQ